MRSTAKYIHSHLSREVEALMVQLAARAHRTSEERRVEHPIYFEPATIFCLCVIIPSTPPSHMSPMAVSGRTPLEFAGAAQV